METYQTAIQNPSPLAAGPDGRVPTLPAERVGEGFRVLVRCCFCGEFHVHGACGPELGDPDGRRCAHCRQPSDDAEYKIKEVPTDPALREVYRRAFERRRARDAARRAKVKLSKSRSKCESSSARQLMQRLHDAGIEGSAV